MQPKKFATKALALMLIAALVLPVRAADPPANGDPEPKFIWGILIKLIAPSVFSMFGDWLKNRLVDALPGGTMTRIAADISGAAIVSLGNYFAGRGGVTTRDVVFVTGENTVKDTPEKPLKVEGDQANYQGVHVALIGVDAAGNVTGYRAVSEGFKSGERFKVRVVSTFAGLMAIDNVNPKGQQRQIYPPKPNTVVSLVAGKETIIPLGRDEYFQLTGATGEEQLIFTIRDPRSLTDKPSQEKVYREDKDFGSNFVQEVTPNTFPVISQVLRLTHN
jgi:hypothetical protein